jgi:hypothetical protein
MVPVVGECSRRALATLIPVFSTALRMLPSPAFMLWDGPARLQVSCSAAMRGVGSLASPSEPEQRVLQRAPWWGNGPRPVCPVWAPGGGRADEFTNGLGQTIGG